MNAVEYDDGIGRTRPDVSNECAELIGDLVCLPRTTKLGEVIRPYKYRNRSGIMDRRIQTKADSVDRVTPNSTVDAGQRRKPLVPDSILDATVAKEDELSRP
jgi:hypothetical protein